MNNKLGKVLRKYRLLKNIGGKLTAKDLAEKAGISAGYYYEIERGLHEPPLKTLALLANALDKSLWEIIKEAEEMEDEMESE